MNFQNMEYFLVVAEEGNITRAARRLNISQQALSNSIARMEAELGCQLFDRRAGLELTYGGRQYRQSVIRMLDLHKQTAAMLEDISGNVRGEVRIGISHTRGQALLPLVLPDFLKKYPKAEMSVTEESTRTLEDRLRHGEVDVLIGFAPFMFEGAAYAPLMRETMFLVIPKTLLAERYPGREEEILEMYGKTRDIRLFREFPFVLLKEGERIRTIADRVFSAAGFAPLIRIETRNMQTAVALAAEGTGITICPELYLNSGYIASGSPDSYIRQRVEICPLLAEGESGYIAVGYNRERYLSHLAEDFIRMTLEKFGRGGEAFPR